MRLRPRYLVGAAVLSALAVWTQGAVRSRDATPRPPSVVSSVSTSTVTTLAPSLDTHGLQVGDPISKATANPRDAYRADGTVDYSKIPAYLPVCDETCSHIGGFVKANDVLNTSPPPATGPAEEPVGATSLVLYDQHGTPVGHFTSQGFVRS
jgi:hypothetical protein